ncbi:MAG: hypothetical protein P0107_02500 [Nitrosomonas sp.]|nr:hypothetical protein [Nitrosomonas sp.]
MRTPDSRTDASPAFGGMAARNWGEENTADIRHPFSRALPSLLPAGLDATDNCLAITTVPRVQTPDFGASLLRRCTWRGEQGYFNHREARAAIHFLLTMAAVIPIGRGKARSFMPGAAQQILYLIRPNSERIIDGSLLSPA